MPDLELKIKQLTAIARREVLPSFNGKTATAVLADRKLRVLYIGCRNQNLVPILIYCLRTTHCHVTKLLYEYVYWPFSINSCACANSVYQATLSWTGNEATVTHMVH